MVVNDYSIWLWMWHKSNLTWKLKLVQLLIHQQIPVWNVTQGKGQWVSLYLKVLAHMPLYSSSVISLKSINGSTAINNTNECNLLSIIILTNYITVTQIRVTWSTNWKSSKIILLSMYLIHGLNIKGGGGRGLSRLDLTVGRFFFLLFGKMSSGWETVEIN